MICCFSISRGLSSRSVSIVEVVDVVVVIVKAVIAAAAAVVVQTYTC